MMMLDLNKPVTIRGYIGMVVSLERLAFAGNTPYYDIEIVDLTSDVNRIIMRMVTPNEISTCV